MEVVRHREEDLLGHLLDARRDVAVEGIERLVLVLAVARRRAHHVVELLCQRRARREVVGEVAHVVPERAVLADPDHLLDAVDVLRLPVGRHAHELVLALVHLEAAVGGERRVQEADRMGEPHLLHDADAVALPDAHGPGGPLAGAVDGEDRRVVVRRGEVARRRVRHVVVGEDDLLRVDPELLLQQVLHPQLLREPGVHRLAEDGPRSRERRERGGEDALELDDRLLVEDDQVEVVRGDAGALQAELDRELREARIVLHPAEALFFRGREDDAVLHDRRRRVVVVEAEPEDVQLNPAFARARACRCARASRPRKSRASA
jgi:hypothetical protein